MFDAPCRSIRLAVALPFLMAGLLASGVPIAGAADAVPAAGPQDDAVMRCFALRRSEPAAAIALAESILASRPLSVENEIKTLSCLGMAAGIAGDARRAVDAADRAVRLLDEHSMPADFALRALSNTGAIYHTAGQISRAEALYLRAYAVAEGADAATAQVVTLTNIALIHSDYLDAPEVAESYYRKALDLATASGYTDLTLLYNHAINLIRLGRHDQSWSALERAAAEARKTESQLFSYRLSAERAALMHEQGQSGEARALLNAAIAVQEGLPDPEGQALSLVRLSTVLRDTGGARGALSHAKAAVRLVDDGAFHRALIEALDALAAAHAALGHASAALAVAERRHALEMSTIKAYERDALAGLQAQLQDAAGMREIERLRHQSDLQALRLDRDRLLRNWVIAVALLLVAGGIAFGLLQRRLNRRLAELSRTDMLTGLINRRAATERLGRHFATDRPPAVDVRDVLLLIDIDRFKDINDRFGHDVGDRVLTEVSARLKAACRPDDLVARWGGEEFLVACTGLSQEQACVVAERLRKAADEPIQLGPDHPLLATVSVGFAPYPFYVDPRGPDEQPVSWQDVAKLADRALYAVKNSGRNAWAGLWGQSQPTLTLDAILKDPEHAARRGDVAVVTSRPVIWRAPLHGALDDAGRRLVPVLY